METLRTDPYLSPGGAGGGGRRILGGSLDF